MGGASYVTLASVALPAGSFLVESEATLFNPTTGTAASCDLVDSTSFEHQVAADSIPGASESVAVPVQAVITLGSPDTISLRCNGVDPSTVAAYWSLAAAEVGSVH